MKTCTAICEIDSQWENFLSGRNPKPLNPQPERGWGEDGEINREGWYVQHCWLLAEALTETHKIYILSQQKIIKCFNKTSLEGPW